MGARAISPTELEEHLVATHRIPEFALWMTHGEVLHEALHMDPPGHQHLDDE